MEIKLTHVKTTNLTDISITIPSSVITGITGENSKEILEVISFSNEFKGSIYFDKERMSLYKVTFSILKIVESKNGNLSVYPINALYDKCDITSERDMLISDCTKIYNTFTGKKEMAIDILDEYVCFEKIKDAL